MSTFNLAFNNFIHMSSDNLTTDEKTETPIIFAPKTYQYDKFALGESDCPKDPIELFTAWFNEAREDPTETIPEAVNVATAELPSGRVSNRVLLFKELDPKGFCIYSNWGSSKKAHDVKTNPHAALTFFWKNLQKQVRVEGVVEYVSRETSERYFETRPRGSKIGAWSSPQSKVIKNREELENIVEANKKKFENVEDVPCPDYWGGIRVVPLEIEFWQGRASRLHDRISYRRKDENSPWEILRLAP
ncbi:Pyridoxamine 5'-phosphate oxidase [Hanseniaspora osmophila]|uniref:pyridoxal 5'-phosphate synthase n=1 Tax=Hanseniaspora osmophila TaxID=56408 RepID=A0A1E5R1A5_9ASCO|nr:Pyridoxamine 5'-phosphate oxidase [Hanseniaspora osmophila]